MKYYYADANNQPVGPHTVEELRELASQGQIQDATWVVEEGGTEWKAFSDVAAAEAPAPAPAPVPKPMPSPQPAAGGAASPGEPKRALSPQPNTGITPTVAATESEGADGGREPVSVLWAVIWFIFCFPIGFMMWGQTGKGWLWFVIALLTGGVGAVVAWIDFWMNWATQNKREVGPWEWFPSA